MPITVFAAKCGDPTHSNDAKIVSAIRGVPGVVDTFESLIRHKGERYCIAAMTIEEGKDLLRVKKELEGISGIKAVTSMSAEQAPF